MKLLFVSDKFDFSPHSAIDSIFNKYLKKYIHVDIVYFSKKNTFEKKENKFLIPYKDRKKIYTYIDLKDYNIVIVRNFFDVLNSLLKLSRNFKVGFQLSFPHSYRRYYQAKVEKKAIIRKSLEYFLKEKIEKRLIYKTDFFLPISEYMINEFFNDIKTPYFILPLGIDPEYVLQKKLIIDEQLKFLYIGTIDKLREFDKLLDVLKEFQKDNWILDIYSSTNLQIDKKLQNKIFQKGYIKRSELLNKINEYDVGIFVLPNVTLYKVASPTKVMEYYQAGIPSLMSNIPECVELFDDNSGFIVNFDKDDLKNSIKKILSMDKLSLINMGYRGQNILLKKRNYKIISKELFDFLKDLV